MPFAAFDDQQAAGLERLATSFDDRQPRSRYHVQPLVRAAVPVVRAAFAVARCDDHFGRLHTAHVEGDAESRPEAEPFVLHAPLAGAATREQVHDRQQDHRAQQ